VQRWQPQSVGVRQLCLRRIGVRGQKSLKTAALKCGGPPTMPEENRGPWSKKFENRWSIGFALNH